MFFKKQAFCSFVYYFDRGGKRLRVASTVAMRNYLEVLFGDPAPQTCGDCGEELRIKSIFFSPNGTDEERTTCFPVKFCLHCDGSPQADISSLSLMISA